MPWLSVFIQKLRMNFQYSQILETEFVMKILTDHYLRKQFGIDGTD